MRAFRGYNFCMNYSHFGERVLGAFQIWKLVDFYPDVHQFLTDLFRVKCVDLM